jgi:hypothetical protein
MRILFTNNTLGARGGTELYVRDVALALLDRGHQPMVFTLEPGEVAAELIAAGVPVTDDLRQLPAFPSLIHGHHAIETTLAAAAFPAVPVLSFCHGPEAWQEAPCRLPNVTRWIAVDESCRRRLVEEENIPAKRVQVLLNFVDLARFSQRPPLPAKPGKALIFSNKMTIQHPVVLAISAACASRGIAVETCGLGFGRPAEFPGDVLRRYDLVFAKARCALEALASGCAVVLADHFGAGRLITTANFDEIRPLNFGFESMTMDATSEYLGAEIDRYDPADSAAVTLRIRSRASLMDTVDRLEEIYREASATSLPDFDPIHAAFDFWRFHLFLSKKPLSAMRRAPGRPFRLPVPPLDKPLDLVWSELCATHSEVSALRLTAMQTKLARREREIAALTAKITILQGGRNPEPARGWRKWLSGKY